MFGPKIMMFVTTPTNTVFVTSEVMRARNALCWRIRFTFCFMRFLLGDTQIVLHIHHFYAHLGT